MDPFHMMYTGIIQEYDRSWIYAIKGLDYREDICLHTKSSKTSPFTVPVVVYTLSIPLVVKTGIAEMRLPETLS